MYDRNKCVCMSVHAYTHTHIKCLMTRYSGWQSNLVVKSLATRPDNMSSILGTHMVKRENWLPEVVHTFILPNVCVHTHTYISKCRKNFFFRQGLTMSSDRETITETYNWSKCREQEAGWCPDTIDTSTSQFPHLRLWDHCETVIRKILRARRTGS